MEQQIKKTIQDIINTIDTDNLQLYQFFNFALLQILETIKQEHFQIQQFYLQQIDNLNIIVNEKQDQIIRLKNGRDIVQSRVYLDKKVNQQTPYKNLLTKMNKQNIDNSECEPISDQKHNIKNLNLNKQPQNRLSLQNHQNLKQRFRDVKETQIYTVAGQDLPILINQKHIGRNRSNTTFCKTLSNEFQYLEQCSRQDFDCCLTARDPKMINSLQSFQSNQHKSLRTKLYRKPENKYKKAFERKKFVQSPNMNNLLNIPIKIITNIKINN